MGSAADEAFEAFWREQFPSVARAAAGITGNVDDGAEVAQEAFARAYQHWNMVSRLERPGGWVRRVAVHIAISRLRRARRRIVPSRPLTAEPPEAPDDELLRALRKLTPAQRAVVVLRFYADLSVEEAARTLRKRPGTVRALTHQAMERLRAILRKEPLDG
jgi:RNA polymerase sigma-70 factor (ECF subfamily)